MTNETTARHVAIGASVHYVTKRGECRSATIVKTLEPFEGRRVSLSVHFLEEDIGVEAFETNTGIGARPVTSFSAEPKPGTWHTRNNRPLV
jgi:hypothetical protein